MADSKEMPRVDMKKEFPNLNETEKHFIRKIENMNLERAGRLTKMKSRNKLTGVLLAGAVFGICILLSLSQ